MVCRLISAFLKTYSLVAFASGQCTNYKLQSNQYKRSSGYQLTSNDVTISDNFLSEGWYRFQSRAGNDMVTTAPSLTKCGTIYPVWLNGSLPNVGDDIVNTTACVVGVYEECESRISIRIANCGSFNVYYLRRTPAFATGYCFGDQVKCPYGLGSENGFTPGCKPFLNISVSPNVAVDLEEGSVLVNGSGPSLISFFECTFNKPTNIMLYFDIIWYINEDEVRRTINANYGNLSSTRLLPGHWVDQYNLNMVVRCAVRVRASAGGTPSHEMSSSDYQAGIFPESFIYHIKEGTTMAIPLRVTYPVGCFTTSLNNTCQTAVYLLTPFYQPSVDTCQNIPSKDAILFNQNRCGIIVTRETWRDTAFLNVTGNIDNLINNDGDREIFIRIGILGKGSEFSGAWDNVRVPDIKVYISDMDEILSDRICKLQTDPRFWTFDGKRHDIYSAGEFVLYRHKKRSIEVRALFTACSGTGDSDELNAACTCGVAIRVEDSLYVYRTCGLVSYRSVISLIHHSAIYEICDDEHMVISTDEDGYTIISLPSGTRVKHSVFENWIEHLHIIPSVFDIDNVEGICGNPNGNASDDFVAPDGRTPASNERLDIDDIINTWKVNLTTSNSLFSANPVLENTAHDRQKYCSCATEASDGNVLQDHAAVCNITKTIVECSKHQTTASFHTTCGRVGNTGRKRRALSEDGLSEKSKRVRRSAKDFDDVIDFVPLLLDPLYNSTYIPQIPTWRKGWNESIARQLCEESINNDPVKLECEKHIDIQKMVNESISSCVLDIRDSASTDWMAGTIDAIKSYCLTRISMYEKFYITNPSEEKPVVKIFKSVTCVNNCSTHGICTDEGKCLCDTGFIDADCSHPIKKPPENIVLPEEGLCRQSIRPCAKTNIVGSFLSGTTIYVKLKIYKISMLGKGMVTNVVKTTAAYRAPNLITVDINSSSRNRKRSVSSEYGLGFDISLSYDNTNFGEDLTFIIYDDSCYSCNSTTVSCTMLDSCLNIPTETSTRRGPSDLSPTFSQGQCTNYELQLNQYKRSSGYQLAGTDVAISDNFLSEGWYRFQSGAGNDMVTSAPSIAMCGTIYPVWLNGSLPLQGDGIVDRTACLVGLTRSCESTIPIKIRNCGTYNVYYLRKTPILASGYCFGEQVRCPDGQGSENGFTPGCQILPAITVSPVVKADLEETPSQNPALGSTKKSYFECTFDKPRMGPYYFDITWYINENEVRRTTNVDYENLSTTRLLPQHWVHQYNLNMVVRCSIRVRTSSGGTPSNEMSSRDYQAGIFPESFIYHLDEGQTMSIPFQVTYPVGCLFTNLESSCKTAIYMLTPYYQSSPVDTCQNIQSTEAVLFNENKCGIVISSNTWNESKVLSVTANIDNLINERDREIYIRLGNNGQGGDPSRAWDDVTIPDIKVYISDVDNTISNRICRLQTDPRLWTFDNEKQHDIHTAGEFVLYRHKKRNVEVHALFTACSGDGGGLGAACTCGVAIRVEDSLYVYRTCDEVSYQTVSLLAHHSTIYEVCDDKHMVITTDAYGYTVITLPSGTTVKYIVSSDWIQHLHIIPSVFDIGNVEGICGNPNGDNSDDFVAPDGRTPASERREDIESIINTWKIDPVSPNSLFGANPSLDNTGHDVQKYCSCATESPTTNFLQNLPDHHAAVCNITTSLVDCSDQQTTVSFLTTCNRFANNGRKRRALSENGFSERSKRVRRSAYDSDDVIDFEPLKYDPSYSFTYTPQIPTWRNGWNESHAIQVCEESINNDPVKLECEKHIDIQKMVNESISSCISDIRDSASTEWVAGTIDAIKSYCLTRISKYEKFYVSNSGEEKSVMEIFNAVTCINNCSKNGQCTDKGKCLCVTGFIGADCSHPINKPPENIVLPEEGLCRQSIRPCAKTNIVGNFLSGTTIYVKVQQYKISILGKGAVINTEKTTAQYRAPNLISVVLPSSTRRRKRSVSSELGLGFDISLSYDNTNFGEELKFIIYDDSCYNCNSTTTTCTILDSCSYSSTDSTTMSSGAPPSYTDNTKMILIIVSAVLAVALIVVAVILFLKFKNKSIKQSNPIYYNTEPVKNGCPPMNTYEHMYSRPFSPPPPYQDPRKTGRPSSSSSIRATFDETKSNHSFNFDIFSVDSQRKNL